MRYPNNLTMPERRLLEALPGAASVVDGDGYITASNKAWVEESECYNWFGIPPAGSNYFEHCEKAVKKGNDHALRLIFGLREILEGNRDHFQITGGFTNDGIEKWCRVTITPVKDEYNKGLIIFGDITEKMKMNLALRDSEERYSQHFKHSLSGIIIGSPDGKIYDANPAACNILGYTKDELMEGGRALIVDESDKAHIEMCHIRDQKSIFEGEKDYIHKDGNYIPVEITSVLYRNEDGEMRVVNTFRDISAEKMAEYTLEEERRFTKAAVNSIPGIFFVIDRNRRLVQWNDALVDEHGYGEEELSGMDVLNLFSPSDKLNAEVIITDTFHSGIAHLLVGLQSKKKGERVFHCYLNSFESGEKKYLVGSGVDMTELIEAETARKKNYNLMAQLFENSPLAMVMINTGNIVKKVNKGFVTLFGYPKEEVIGKDINLLIADETTQQEAEEITRLALQGKGSQQETTRQTKTGKNVPVLMNSVPIRNNGEIIALYGIYVDLTEQKKLEREIKNSLEEKGILLQEVHHRVKNNLAVISGLLDLQMMQEEDRGIEKKLIEIRSRIFSIAKIHETLYEQEDVVNIRFDKYLETMISAAPQFGLNSDSKIKLDLTADVLLLNLNQAVPCGLAFNEVLNMALPQNGNHCDLTVNLKSDGEDIELSVAGKSIKIEKLEKRKGKAVFQKQLLEIFLTQVNAELVMEKNPEDRIVIRFKKNNARGSSSSWINRFGT